MAIAWVKQVGTDQDNVLDGTLTITVPVAGVAAGNTVVVSVACDDGVPTSVSDNKGNGPSGSYRLTTYNKSANSVFGALAYAYCSTALVSGDTITISWGAGTSRPKNAVAHEFSGVADAAPDVSIATATGFTSGNWSAGSITTTNADDLLISSWAIQGDITPPTLTKDANYTEDMNYLGQTVARDVGVHMEHRIVAATGAYNDTINSNVSHHWAAAHFALKAATTGVALAAVIAGLGVSTPTLTDQKALATTLVGRATSIPSLSVSKPLAAILGGRATVAAFLTAGASSARKTIRNWFFRLIS